MASPARFPISGPKENPTTEDYALEAALLRQQARAINHASGKPHSGGLPEYELAKRFDRIARRKQCADAMRPRQAADEAA